MQEEYIIIGGDLVPTDENYRIFQDANIDLLLSDEIKNIWYNASLRIFNLETPVSNRKEWLKKAGTFLSTSKVTFNGIKELNPDLVCLSNNHIMDLGEGGARDTVKLLEENNISYIGFGNNLYEMKDFHTINLDGKIFGFFNCCEHEFSYATHNKCGTNPFNPLTSLFRIQAIKKECDFLTVIYHGGKELYQYCTPKLQEIAHSIVKAGADLIVCQHSHCVSCYEKVDKSYIVYGQGNFIFDLDEPGEWNNLTKNSMFIKININDLTIDFVSFTKNGHSLILNDDKKEINLFNKRSNEILEKDFVEKIYIEYIKHNSYHYFRQLLGTRIIGEFDKKFLNSFFMKRRYKKLRLLFINYFDCEVHLETILTYLKNIDELYEE